MNEAISYEEYFISKKSREIQIKASTTVSKSTLIAINNILNYLWDDEARHFEESNQPENHIFLDLQRVKKLFQ